MKTLENEIHNTGLKTAIIKIEAQISPDGPVYTKTFEAYYTATESLLGNLKTPLEKVMIEAIKYGRTG